MAKRKKKATSKRKATRKKVTKRKAKKKATRKKVTKRKTKKKATRKKVAGRKIKKRPVRRRKRNGGGGDLIVSKSALGGRALGVVGAGAALILMPGDVGDVEPLIYVCPECGRRRVRRAIPKRKLKCPVHKMTAMEQVTP